MTDTEQTSPARTPSKFPPAVASVIGGLPGTCVAFLTAVAGVIGAMQSYQESQATARASYDALKVRLEQLAATQAQSSREALELRTWVEQLSARQERAQATVAEAVRPARVRPARRPGEPAAPATPVIIAPAPPAEPAPPAPAITPAPEPLALPPFEHLAK